MSTDTPNDVALAIQKLVSYVKAGVQDDKRSLDNAIRTTVHKDCKVRPSWSEERLSRKKKKNRRRRRRRRMC